MRAPAVWGGDFPDPFVLRADDGYFAYGTNAGGRNVQVLRSADLVTWRPVEDALPHLPGWAAGGRTWAPSVLSRPDGWVLYVTVREPRSDRQAIMVARAASPAGPFEPVGDGPLVFQIEDGGSIDPSPFVDVDGTAWLSWKADANAVHRPSTLWTQRLTADGLGLIGAPTKTLDFDAGWEQPLVEAPAMVRDDDRYYLFYSAGWWASDRYGIGYAVSDSPLGPWRKVTDRHPWMGSDRSVSGPGGQELFTDVDGRVWMAFHAWEPGHVTYRAGGRRTLRLVPISFVEGRPVAEGMDPRPPPPGWWRRLLPRA